MQLFLVIGEEFAAQDLSVFSGSFEEVEADPGGGLWVCVYGVGWGFPARESP